MDEVEKLVDENWDRVSAGYYDQWENEHQFHHSYPRHMFSVMANETDGLAAFCRTQYQAMNAMNRLMSMGYTCARVQSYAFEPETEMMDVESMESQLENPLGIWLLDEEE